MSRKRKFEGVNGRQVIIIGNYIKGAVRQFENNLVNEENYLEKVKSRSIKNNDDK
jgi:hypothetical protein